MKKTLIITSLFLLAIANKATAQLGLVIDNTTICNVTVSLWAHDAGGGGACSGTTCGTFTSIGINVSGGNSLNVNTQLWVNDPSICGFGNSKWLGGLCYSNSCFPSGPNYGWDGAVITGTFSGSISVGAGTCFSGTSGSSILADDCASSTVYADWSVSGTQVTLKIHY